MARWPSCPRPRHPAVIQLRAWNAGGDVILTAFGPQSGRRRGWLSAAGPFSACDPHSVRGCQPANHAGQILRVRRLEKLNQCVCGMGLDASFLKQCLHFFIPFSFPPPTTFLISSVQHSHSISTHQPNRPIEPKCQLLYGVVEGEQTLQRNDIDIIGRKRNNRK